MAEQILCINLERLRQEVRTDGAIEIDSKDSPIAAKLAIAHSLGSLRFKEQTDSPAELEIPIIPATANFLKHHRFIRTARREAEKSKCWMGKVGAVVVENGVVIDRGHNDPLIPTACSSLSVDPKKIMQLLGSGERFDFCQAIHDVEGIVARAARDGQSLRSKQWYLSLEPCDRCANLLVINEPKTVYFAYGIGRTKYYNSMGLQRLLDAKIPVYRVIMPEDEAAEKR